MKKRQSESGTALVVNDEEAICNVVREMLERTGYRVLEAHDAEGALEICRQSWERIDLLLTDIMMPGASGRALAERATTFRPRMKVIYMSGNVDVLLRQGVLTPDMPYLRKPFTESELLSKIREVLRPNRQIACPRCSSTNVRASRRRWSDWLLTLVFVAPYRCRDCRTRFFRFGVRLRNFLRKHLY